MLEFKNLEEMKPYFNYKSNTYRFNDNVRFCFDFLADSNIDAWNINARNINARNIDAVNIDALDIDARNINARNIDAGNIDAANIDAADIDAWNIDALDIDARNIDAGNINARNINAWNIDALDIDAEDIEYYAVCIAYQTFSCRSVRGKRENAIHACLDGEIEYREEDADDGNKRNEKED